MSLSEMDYILSIVGTYEKGAGISDILSTPGFDIPIRTLQRRLAKLEKQGLISTSGNRRLRLYSIVNTPAVSMAGNKEQETAGVLPAEAAIVFQYMSRPAEQRNSIGYDRFFLDSYQPNVSYYLDENERLLLLGMGKTELPNQPAGTYARYILNRLLIDLAWNSSRLEGNTYSLLDTHRLIAVGETPDNKSALETQMILNHKEAIEFLVQDSPDIGINRFTLLNLHALLSNNLLADPGAPGRLRTFPVRIAQSAYTPPSMPQLIEELFEEILQKAGQIQDPFEQAFFLMLHIPYLQPFDDVNKRVSRLAANIPLNGHNLAPLSFTEVSGDLYTKGLLGVYELNDTALLKYVFINAYEKSAAKYAKLRQTVGEPDPFRIQYREQLRALISTIIGKNLTRTLAAEMIDARAAILPEQDKNRFVEAAQNELLALHDGNFARYQVTPLQFRSWKESWDKS